MQIVLEMRKAKMLDQQLGEVHSTLTQTRSAMGSIFSAKEQSQGVMKRIKLLENRLEKAYVKYNQSITHNKQLREQINNLRRERIMFESINNNLERELAKLKREMAETIQLANAAFEAKEKALQEMNTLKVQSEKEQAGFEEEWKQLTAIIDDDKRERVRARIGMQQLSSIVCALTRPRIARALVGAGQRSFSLCMRRIGGLPLPPVLHRLACSARIQASVQLKCSACVGCCMHSCPRTGHRASSLVA